MPVIPNNVNLVGSSVDILNAIRNNATANYKDYIPAANPDQKSIREIGAVIMQYPALQNEFLTALINRIGMVLITSRSYDNPWAVFKRGMMELGETVEEIFVNIAKPFNFDPAVAENKVFARQIPDVRAAFHVLNFQKFYKVTTSEAQLRQAFLSWSGVSDLISGIIESMYKAMNYDEFLTMKYMIAREILNGRMYPIAAGIGDGGAAGSKAFAANIKGVSNALVFLSTKYNPTGVATNTDKDDQYLILSADVDAIMDVEVLASAFNMDKAKFAGHRILIDSFSEMDTARLAELFAEDPAYVELTGDEVTLLAGVKGVLVDRRWFMIFDNLLTLKTKENEEGLYWNHWLHAWKIFSASPFSNAIVFASETPAITSVEVTPAAATVMPGQTIVLDATVVTEGFATKAVKWTATVSGDPTDEVSVDPLGVVAIDKDITAGTVITVKAESVLDSTKYDTSTLTVYDPD